MKKIIIAFLLLIAVGVGAYYIIFNKNSSTTSTNTSQTYIPSVSIPSALDNSKSAIINIKDFSFNPPTLTIKTGTKVTWVNNDSAPHTVTSDSSGLLNSSTLSQGQSFSFIFADSGSITYHCSIHPMMKGNLTVTP